MNDNAYLLALGSTLLIFALVLIAMMHDKDVKVDCVKLAIKEHYSVDDIDKLCGVGK